MTILELQYADGNALVTHTEEEDLQAAVDAFSDAYDVLGLTLNIRKTQVLFQPSLPPTRVKTARYHSRRPMPYLC